MRIDKLKGVFLTSLGIIWVAFVNNFDLLMHKPRIFGTKAVICFIAGAVMIVNGIRIYNRRG